MDDFILYFEWSIIVKERVSDMKSFVCCALPNILSLREISFICSCGTLFLCMKIFREIFMWCERAPSSLDTLLGNWQPFFWLTSKGLLMETGMLYPLSNRRRNWPFQVITNSSDMYLQLQKKKHFFSVWWLLWLVSMETMNVSSSQFSLYTPSKAFIFCLKQTKFIIYICLTINLNFNDVPNT